MKKRYSAKRILVLKKVLFGILLVIFGGVLTGGFFIWTRYQENPEQIVPFPYRFETPAPLLKLDAPILIAGDRMGFYFAKFSTPLAETISVNLEKPIKIQTIARPRYGLHRTLHQLRSLSQWPQILIYQGGSEEFNERKFNLEEMTKIRHNFELYKNDKIQTLLILKPWLSRLFYTPINRMLLPAIPSEEDQDQNQEEYVKRLETELLLFEQQLLELVRMSKDRNTLLILTTMPLNLDEAPKKVCDFSTTPDIEAEVIALKQLIENGNFKGASTMASKLLAKYSGNAELLFLHGQIAKRLGNVADAIDSLLSASAYDCLPWRGNEVHNSIIRKVAREQQILLFDFAKLVEGDFNANTTFFDEIHPQNLYYDKAMEQLGLVIKSILKL